MEGIVQSKIFLNGFLSSTEKRITHSNNFLDIRCAELERTTATEKSLLSSQVAELKKNLDAALMKSDSFAAELLRLQKISGITEENQRLEISALTDRCLRVTHQREAETAMRRQCEERANKYDLAEAELLRLRKEVSEK